MSECKGYEKDGETTLEGRMQALINRAESAEALVAEQRNAVAYLLRQFSPEHLDSVSGTDIGKRLKELIALTPADMAVELERLRGENTHLRNGCTVTHLEGKVARLEQQLAAAHARIERLENELDCSCNAEELTQARADLTAAKAKLEQYERAHLSGAATKCLEWEACERERDALRAQVERLKVDVTTSNDLHSDEQQERIKLAAQVAGLVKAIEVSLEGAYSLASVEVLRAALKATKP